MAQVTLRPSGDGTTTGWTRVAASGTFASKIVDDPDSHDSDTSYVLSPNAADGQMWVDLDDVPADFDPDGITAISLKAAAKKVNTPVMAVDTSDLYLELQRTDESTAISTESAVCNVTDTANYVLFTRSVSVSGTHTVTDWNGAKIRLRFDHITQQTIDTVNQVRITAVEVVIDYTPLPIALAGTSASASLASGSLSVARPLAGTVAGLATVSGSAILAIAFVGTSGAASTVSGNAILAVAMTGAVGAASVGAGELTVTAGSGVALDGVVAATSTGAGQLALQAALAGTVNGVSLAFGDLGFLAELSGTVQATSGAAAVASIVRGIAGTVVSTSTTNGSIICLWALRGTTAASCLLTGALQIAETFVPTLHGTSIAVESLRGVGLSEPLFTFGITESVILDGGQESSATARISESVKGSSGEGA